MKYIKGFLCCCMVLLLASCFSASKYYKEGIESLDVKNYVNAEENLKKAIDNGYTRNNVKVIYSIVSEYNDAKQYYDKREYDKASMHIGKIPHSYSDYSIGVDVDFLKSQLKECEKISSSISKAQSLLDSGEYEDANEIVLAIDTKYATDEQLTEIENIRLQIKLERKNNDYYVLNKIDALVENYVYALCESVNTGDFRALKGCLYEGSSIYKTQQSYIANMAKKDVYEYVKDYKVNSVDWKSETSCVISTIETYEIYVGDDYRTQTFRYTYDVIETNDKQLFLTSIKKSS